MTRVAWAIVVGITLTAGAGCYHPGPYAPNYGAYPTYPSMPPGSYPVAPSGSFVNPTPTVPGTFGPTTPYPTQQGPTIAPPLNDGGMNGGSGGDAPPATFEGGADPGGAVPNYEDPSSSDFGTAPSGDGFQPPEEGSPFMDGQGTAIPQPNGYASAAPPTRSPDYFAELSDYGANPSASPPPNSSPSGVQPAGYEQEAVHDEFGARPQPLGGANGGQNPEFYGYDHDGYRWLRGVVDFDPVTKEWAIVYGLIPEKGDRFGGQLTLSNHPSLADLKTNDVVEVRGQIDSAAGTDRLGKPYYRVEGAKLLGRYE